MPPIVMNNVYSSNNINNIYCLSNLKNQAIDNNEWYHYGYKVTLQSKRIKVNSVKA